MRLLLTGGGTGGHVIPNIALIEELKDTHPDVDVAYIGESRSIEKRLITEQGIAFHIIPAGKLRRYWSLKNIWDIGKTGFGIIRSLYLLVALQPDVIFAKGGYVSLPVGVAAWILRKKVIIHESDISPGLSTKILSITANKILLSHKNSKKFFSKKQQKKCVVVGNPVRKSIYTGKKSKALTMLKWSGRKKTILIMGGSMGSVSVNTKMQKAIPTLLKKYRIVHLIGKNSKPTTKDKHYRAFEYVNEEMKDILALADLIIARSGANTVAEIEALGKKSILIPLPLAASRGEQYENAKMLEKKGCALIINEEECTKEKIIENVEAMIGDTILSKTLDTTLKKKKNDATTKILAELGIR